MEFDIHAGKRVLYKNGNSNWLTGIVCEAENAEVNEKGIWVPIAPIDPNLEGEVHWAEIHNIFCDTVPLDSWMTNYPEYYMTKEQYIQFMNSEEFDRRLENAYFSDGQYVYYPVSKFSESWIMKQPFDYIARYDK